jgi:hypothetical protein
MRWSPLAIAALVVAGCGRDAPPGMFVGESAHFRLFVDPALGDTSVTWAEANGLAALETEWSDVETMLKMPDGKITYYWLTSDDVPAACGSNEGACTWEQSLEIDSPLLPNPHELTHAYMYLRKQRHPIPFLAEGMAETNDCGLNRPKAFDTVPWPGLVAAGENDLSTLQGGVFMRYLIRRFGIDAVLRYYEQGPERRDPALFAANFESFWGVTLDDAWADMNTPLPGLYFPQDAKICPCSLPPPVPGPQVDDRARAPYWTLPDTGGSSIALTGMWLDMARVFDCAGVQSSIEAEGVLARLDGVSRRYVVRPLVDVEVGDYVADDCASVVPYTIGSQFVTQYGLAVAVPTPPGGTATVFVAVESASPFTLVGSAQQEYCSSCAFDQGACQPSAPASLPGTVFERLNIGADHWHTYVDMAQGKVALQ